MFTVCLQAVSKNRPIKKKVVKEEEPVQTFNQNDTNQDDTVIISRAASTAEKDLKVGV